MFFFNDYVLPVTQLASEAKHDSAYAMDFLCSGVSEHSLASLERQIAQTKKEILLNCYLLTCVNHLPVSSTIQREFARKGISEDYRCRMAEKPEIGPKSDKFGYLHLFKLGVS